ncbi:MAG: hypothetical protein A3G35_12850 [candidate division NC10 bacterium RIFCSPLOWO2_12_FULL_66_18]|nr:MAG: hypothetical protein A3G35_12850 [candidate division NC10 bacterium RIFCSPLOWO2_12_FULL_66_18]
MAEEKAAKGAHGGEAPSLDATIWSRRDLFSLAGWAGVAGVIGASLLAFTRFMFPRVLFEPSPVFAADRPENFAPGAVDERWKKGEHVWIGPPRRWGLLCPAGHLHSPRVHPQLVQC